MRVAIMQPTYLPWAGYFGLMNSVDVFVLLDSVQFARRSWQQRNQIKTAKGAQWLTVPVSSSGKRDQLISEVQIDAALRFQIAHHKSIEMNYGKTQYYTKYAYSLLSRLDQKYELLVDLTIALIMHLKEQMSIKTQVVRASDLDCKGKKADLLASICRHIGATSYISPPGSEGYLAESEAFKYIDVPVCYYEFIHPQYEQPFGEFLPYMSVIDMLFNCGDITMSKIEKAGRVV